MHYLAANESLSTVAQTCSTTTAAIVDGNPQITDPNVVFAGLPVCVPSSCCTALKCSDGPATSTPDNGEFSGCPTLHLHCCTACQQGSCPSHVSQVTFSSAVLLETIYLFIFLACNFHHCTTSLMNFLLVQAHRLALVPMVPCTFLLRASISPLLQRCAASQARLWRLQTPRSPTSISSLAACQSVCRLAAAQFSNAQG